MPSPWNMGVSLNKPSNPLDVKQLRPHRSLLPPNTTRAERALEATTARLSDLAVPLRNLYNPATCPVELLPWLAWQLSIDNWRSTWSEEIRRARVKNAIHIHRKKGTAKSVRDVVASFGGSIVLREWWQQTPKGKPHTFALLMTLSGSGNQQASAEFVDDVIAEVNRTKPVRSHFHFTQGVESHGTLAMVSAIRCAVYSRLNLAEPIGSN